MGFRAGFIEGSVHKYFSKSIGIILRSSGYSLTVDSTNLQLISQDGQFVNLLRATPREMECEDGDIFDLRIFQLED